MQRVKEQSAKGNRKYVRPLEAKLLIGQAKQNSTTHLEPIVGAREVWRHVYLVRDRAVAAVATPTAAAEDATRARGVICIIATISPFPHIPRHIIHPIAV